MMEKLRTWVGEVQIWFANGQAYANYAKYPIAAITAVKVLFPQYSYKTLIILACIMFIGMIFVGWFDLRFLKFHQRKMEIETEKYNPYFSKLKKAVTNAKSKIQKRR